MYFVQAPHLEAENAMKGEYADTQAYNGIQNVERATPFAISSEDSNRKKVVLPRTNDEHISM